MPRSGLRFLALALSVLLTALPASPCRQPCRAARHASPAFAALLPPPPFARLPRPHATSPTRALPPACRVRRLALAALSPHTALVLCPRCGPSPPHCSPRLAARPPLGARSRPSLTHSLFPRRVVPDPAAFLPRRPRPCRPSPLPSLPPPPAPRSRPCCGLLSRCASLVLTALLLAQPPALALTAPPVLAASPASVPLLPLCCAFSCRPVRPARVARLRRVSPSAPPATLPGEPDPNHPLHPGRTCPQPARPSTAFRNPLPRPPPPVNWHRGRPPVVWWGLVWWGWSPERGVGVRTRTSPGVWQGGR
ncbi:hypothetical protein JOD54_002261 [Actinokineospora baliensis]|nr:hypothetical protein [Actinokineospora baliensis]